jgi:transcriptional regulator with XRE-family HTH domain
MITSEQIRAARGLLNWTQTDLAGESGISLASINNIERDIGSPRPDTLRTLEETFITAGVEFIGQHGVQKSRDIFTIYNKQDDSFIKIWLDDFYSCIRDSNDDALFFGISEKDYVDYVPEQVIRYESLQKKTGFVERIILHEGDTFLLTSPSCYRWLSSDMLGKLPYIIYKDRVAMFDYPRKRIIIIRNQSIADNFRLQFEHMWALGKPLPSHAKNNLEDPEFREFVAKAKPLK